MVIALNTDSNAPINKFADYVHHGRPERCNSEDDSVLQEEQQIGNCKLRIECFHLNLQPVI